MVRPGREGGRSMASKYMAWPGLGMAWYGGFVTDIFPSL